MYVSNSLYRKLPHLYVLSGFVTIASIEHPLTFISGSLFTLAGLLVFSLRLNAKTKRL